ncbi:phosphoketolase family protein [Mesorhizobium atlanticum]
MSSSPAKPIPAQWLSIEEAKVHCSAGIGIWEWASTDGGAEPDVVMACAGDVPTLEDAGRRSDPGGATFPTSRFVW